MNEGDTSITGTTRNPDSRSASRVPSDAVARSGSLALIVAGVLGAASALFLAYVPSELPEERFSYPLDAGGFIAIQVFFFVHHLALAWGLWAVWRSGAAGHGRFATIGGAGSVVTMGLLAVQELVAISAATASYPSTLADTVGGVYGGVSLLNGVVLILFGVSVLRAGRWTGWSRWLPLLLGVYVIVPLTPAIFGPFVLARLTIGLWMLLFAALGWALRREGR
jgi:hypothetical protein